MICPYSNTSNLFRKYVYTFLLQLAFVSVFSQQFTEVSDSIGLNYQYPGTSGFQIGAGITVFDFNNDGWDDIFQPGGIFRSKLWKNNGNGNFIDVSSSAGIDFLDSFYVLGVVAGDIDNDGWEDLFIANFGKGIGPNGDLQKLCLLKNNGNGSFTPILNSGINEKGFFTAATMGDFNKDRLLDIYAANYIDVMHSLEDSAHNQIGYDPLCQPNVFYVNNGGNQFSNQANNYALNDSGCGLAAIFSDYDNDNDVDLLLANDFGEWNKRGNQLFQNNYPSNSLSHKGQASNFYQEFYGMGIGPGDYDNDGDIDYFITNIGANRLLRNNNDGTFTDVALATGVKDEFVKDTLRGTSWSGLFFDYDNDMDLDLYITKGNVEQFIPPSVVKDPNKLYRNNGDGTFTDISKVSGANDSLSHRGAAIFDYDHDGDLDIVSSPIKMGLAAFSGLDQKVKFFRNNSNHSYNRKIQTCIFQNSNLQLFVSVEDIKKPSLEGFFILPKWCLISV